MIHTIHFNEGCEVSFSEEDGAVWIINKPLRWTSFDVVNKLKQEIRRQTGLKKFKIGHAGTLDPLAEGVLLVCVGKATKRIECLQSMPKTYTGTFVLGATTASYDLEHPVKQVGSIAHLDRMDVETACRAMLGVQQQVPPLFSAVKLDGKSAFQYARQGEEVALKSKEIEIYDFQLPRVELPEVDFEIHCSKGTYIRSIARDLGNKLGCGAYLKRLCRTAVGDCRISDALPLNNFFVSRQDFQIKKKKRFEEDFQDSSEGQE